MYPTRLLQASAENAKDVIKDQKNLFRIAVSVSRVTTHTKVVAWGDYIIDTTFKGDVEDTLRTIAAFVHKLGSATDDATRAFAVKGYYLENGDGSTAYVEVLPGPLNVVTDLW